MPSRMENKAWSIKCSLLKSNCVPWHHKDRMTLVDPFHVSAIFSYYHFSVKTGLCCSRQDSTEMCLIFTVTKRLSQMTKSKRAYHLDQRSRPSLTSGSPQPFRVRDPSPSLTTLTPSDALSVQLGEGEEPIYIKFPVILMKCGAQYRAIQSEQT